LAAKSALETIVAAFASLLLAGAFLSRGLAPDLAPVSIDPLYTDARAVPFSEVRPEGFEPRNPAVSDTATVFYPWFLYFARSVASGDFPLWTPLSGGGLPFAGNLSSAVFFPTTWLVLIEGLGVGFAMTLGALLRLAVAGFFGYLLLRRRGAPPVAAAAGGAVFALFGYQVLWLFYSLSNVACLLPLALWLADRFVSRPGAIRGSWLAAGLGLQFLGGHAETSLALAIAVVAWIGGAGGLRILWRFAPYGVASLLLCAFQLLPFVEYLALSAGRAERMVTTSPTATALPLGTPLGWFVALLAAMLALFGVAMLQPGGGDRVGRVRDAWCGVVAGAAFAAAGYAFDALGMRELLPLLLDPDRFGNPLDGVPYRGPEAYPDVNGGYCGALALLLACLHWLVGRDRVAARVGAGLAVLGVSFAFHIEPVRSLLTSVPGMALAAGTRMLPLVGAAVAIGCGLALADLLGRDRLVRARYAAAWRRVLAAAAAKAAIVLLAAIAPEPRASAPPDPALLPRIEVPAPGTVLVPQRDAKLGTELRIAIAGRAPPAATRVDVRIGDGVLPAIEVREGRFATEWRAHRIDAGEYQLQPMAHTGDGVVAGSPTRVRIDRGAATGAMAWLRIAIAVVFLSLLVATAPFAQRLSRGALALVAVTWIVAELFAFAFDYNPFEEERLAFPRTALTDFLANERDAAAERGEGPFRVLCEDVILQPNMNHAYDLQVVRAYDQLENERFHALVKVWTRDQPFVRYNRETVDVTDRLGRLLNLRYLVTAKPMPPDSPLKLVHAGAGRVYRNPLAMPRAFVVGQAIDVRERPLAEIEPLILTHALLEEAPPRSLGGQGAVTFRAYQPDRAFLEVEADGPALVVMSDNHYPGWRAYVDGEERRILRSHFTFRAVEVPAGRSMVEFRFEPASVTYGSWLAGLAAAILLARVVWEQRRARRANPLRTAFATGYDSPRDERRGIGDD
jgi:hypothetical protein